MPIQISVESIQRYCDPFTNTVWGLRRPVTRDDIAKAINKGNFVTNHKYANSFSNHVKRIAYFVVHGWNDAINLDVGVPALGCVMSWMIVDGNHRFAAAIFRGDKNIMATVDGDLNWGKAILGVNVEED
jgi:hypothetical protein